MTKAAEANKVEGATGMGACQTLMYTAQFEESPRAFSERSNKANIPTRP